MQYTNVKILLDVNQYENITSIFTSSLSDVIRDYFVNTDYRY